MLVAAMAFFAAVDAFVKILSTSQSAGQIIMVSSFLSFLVYWMLLRRENRVVWSRDALNPMLLLRSFGEAVGSTGIVFALGLAPLSTVIALSQAQPLVVVMGAALFLGETVGWRRWAAVGIGMIGVLIILRPGMGAFDPNLLWVFVYIFGLAIRDLTSRRLPSHISTAFAVAWSLLPLVVVGGIIMMLQGGWQPIDVGAALYYIILVGAVSAALWAMTTAMRVGEVSVVAPFRYTRIVFALIIAYFIFDEVPDLLTWIGVGLIVGSGVYTFLRERRLAEGKGT
ncbi:DMT family transporter [Rhodobacteraceae bacterium]|nr:DMT family transporter [Paracoccaceae bacterium]